MKIKEQKGSITLFVLVSMLFFVVIVVGIFVNSSYKVQKQQREIESIQKSYGTEDPDELYKKIISESM